ncbi:MAG: type III pantothenate kinase [Flavobacteriales bacterium]|nr:type III pantothenate kinase [Flavobacteriales bacterium]
MNLIIDIGNSSSKVAIFKGKEIVKYKTFDKITLPNILPFTNDFDISASIISSVIEIDNRIQAVISYFNSLILTHNTALPILSNYKTPKTLGKDRLAAIVGANNKFLNRDILVIDAGSCITFDYFTNGNYSGGRISPGIQMRYDALHTFTAKLPQINFSNKHFMIGNDTNSSIIAGVQQGVLDEVDEGITTFIKENPESIVIVCGGSHKFFEKHLKNSIFADPLIVLKGLNIILEFNAKK